MEAEADSMAATDLPALSDEDLAVEMARRQRGSDPLGGGVLSATSSLSPTACGCSDRSTTTRCRPADPYEFVDLLAGSGLLSVSRNAASRSWRESGSPRT